jgi:hypothetical protein
MLSEYIALARNHPMLAAPFVIATAVLCVYLFDALREIWRRQ